MKESKISGERIKQLIDEAVSGFIKEQNPTIPQTQARAVAGPQGAAAVRQTPTQTSATVAPKVAPMAKPKPKTTVVKFDSETDTPFTVKFSERGFSIGGTRLSFETLDNALSKGYNITLEHGAGLELTPVRMQKILKYEDKY
jgi:hypothetical protein